MPSKEILLVFGRLVIAAIIIVCLLLGVVALLIWHTGHSPRRRPLRPPRAPSNNDSSAERDQER